MKPAVVLRLALAGTRADTVRVVLTGVSALLATLALLSALTVLAIKAPLQPVEQYEAGADGPHRTIWQPANSEQYVNTLLREPGLRPGLALALVLLMIPVLALAGQCSRLGAPARDRRLAAIRLAGASPGQTVLIAVAETGLAALLGTAGGFGAYLLGRYLLHRPRSDGRLLLPTDVLPAPWVLVAAGLGLPLLAALAAAIVLRRVTVSPFGVVKRVRRKRAPWPWPGILIAVGLGSFAVLSAWMAARREEDPALPGWVVLLVLFGGTFLAALGVVLGAGWITYTAGRLLRRYARRPAGLLAGGRLMSDPWSGSRNLAAMLTCVLFGAGGAGVRAWLVSDQLTQAERNGLQSVSMGGSFEPYEPDPFYTQTMDLINVAVGVAVVIAAGGLVVAVVESIVTNRRSSASLVATGTPRAVLARAILWQSLAPATPAILLAVVVGIAIPRGIASESVSGGYSATYCTAAGEVCADPARAAQYTKTVFVPEVVHRIPIPYEHLAVAGLLGLVAVLGTAAIGLLFLRSSTDLEELRAT